MSMTWNATVTNQGIQLQTKQVQGSTLAFTRAVSGSGTVPVVNLKEQTAVSNIQQTLNIETITMGVMQYVMNILLSNTNLQTGYNLSQIGLYATDPDVGEILFAIAQLDTPKEIPSYTESPGYNLELSMTFANTQGANVTITPDLAGYITEGAAQTLISNAVNPLQDDVDEIKEELDNLDITVEVNMLSTEWTAETSIGTLTIERIRFLNGNYYAVGSGGKVYTSTDGKTWTNLNTTGITTEIEDIAYSEQLGIFVALADGRPYWSTNAVAWTLSDVDWNDDAIALCYGESSGNGIFVMTSQLYAWYSTDGKTWTQASITGTSAGFFREIAFAPDVNGRPMFVAVGDMGETMYSLNGRRWYEGGIVADTGLNTIAYAYGRFMISGNNSQYEVTYYSLDGLTWTEITNDIILYRIVAYKGIFVGFGQNNTIYTSVDGESWNLQGTIPTSVGTFNDISSAGDLLFVHNNYQTNGIIAYNAGMVSTMESMSKLSGLFNNILPNKEAIYKLDEQVAESAAAIDDLNTKAGQSTAISMFSFDENDNVVKTYDEDDKKTTEERLGLINETNVDAAMQGYTKNKTAIDNINEDIAGTTTTEGNPITVSDAAPVNAVNLSVDLEPIQDLHGYDHPWVGGAGKNLLPMTVEGIKSANTDGAWNGNVYTHVYGVQFTILTDNDNNVIGIKLNGTPTNNIIFDLGNTNFYANKTYILNGTVANNVGASLSIMGIISDFGEGCSYTPTSDDLNRRVIVDITGRSAINNLIFYPMIRLSTEIDSTFAPYTNICPISGRSEESIQRVGKNLFDKSTITDESWLDGDDGHVVSAQNHFVTDFIKVYKNKTIFIPATGTARRFMYDNNKVAYEYLNNNEAQAYTPPIDGYIRVTGNKATISKDVLQIELGSTATTYEPYAGKTYTIQIGQTVYGCHYDVTRGKMVVDRGVVDLGSLTWGKSSYIDSGFYASLSYRYASDTVMVASSYNYLGTTEAGTSILPSKPNGTLMCHYETQYVYEEIYIRDDRYTDASTFKTAVTGQQLVYELATPFTIPLTPEQIELLENNNTIYADAGDITLTYQPNNAIGEAVRIAEQYSDSRVAEVNARLDGEGNSSRNLLNILNQRLFSGAMTVNANSQNGLIQNIHISGSMGGDSYKDFKIGTIDLKANVRYKMTGGIANSIILKVTRPAGSTAWIYGQPEDSGDGAVFWSNQDITADFILHIYTGTGSSGVDIYPMICVLNDEATAYEPHYPTNKELAAAIVPIKHKFVSGITNEVGAIALISKSEFTSGHKIIPLFVGETSIGSSGILDRCFVRFDSYFSSSGGSVIGYWSQYDPGSGAEIKLANTDVAGIFYYIELEG